MSNFGNRDREEDVFVFSEELSEEQNKLVQVLLGDIDKVSSYL